MLRTTWRAASFFRSVSTSKGPTRNLDSYVAGLLLGGLKSSGLCSAGVLRLVRVPSVAVTLTMLLFCFEAKPTQFLGPPCETPRILLKSIRVRWPGFMESSHAASSSSFSGSTRSKSTVGPRLNLPGMVAQNAQNDFEYDRLIREERILYIADRAHVVHVKYSFDVSTVLTTVVLIRPVRGGPHAIFFVQML
jgi:hypothetical protein